MSPCSGTTIWKISRGTAEESLTLPLARRSRLGHDARVLRTWARTYLSLVVKAYYERRAARGDVAARGWLEDH
jgi:hypothetical protein